jgi:hypothetical protein
MIEPRVLLEQSMDNDTVYVVALDEQGFITKSVLLGQAHEIDDAEELAKTQGWVVIDEWFEGETSYFVDLEPRTAIATVVGSEIPYTDDELLALLKSNGLPEAEKVEKREAQADEGKTLVTVSLGVPRNWSWE